ncbi:MAG TPA: hypothetical protein PLP25_10840 [Candidatus Limiplasma sp.]|nr:hypothetical protein [Candidatus Limiplasma sp.]HPS82339.1 hypothetical protein [Candidatus Limiplasma sp.]
MKKTLVLILTLMLCLLAGGAVAETATEAPANDNAVQVSPVENGTVVPFTDHNFQITLPSDWNVLEVTDDQASAGIIFSCANPEATRSFNIAFSQFDTATDLNAVATELAATYQNVQMLTINDIPFVSYDVPANSVTGIATLNADGTGFYQFLFYPNTDADYSTLALQIAASINTIQ